MYRIDELLNVEGLFHSFSTIDDGNMSFTFDREAIVIKRRKKFFKKLNIDPSLAVAPYLQHSNQVLVADDKYNGKGILDWRTSPKVDAMITNHNNTFLFMLVADCIPLVVYDSVARALGLIHVGWRGQKTELLKKRLKL